MVCESVVEIPRLQGHRSVRAILSIYTRIDCRIANAESRKWRVKLIVLWVR
jgi:hypothetical protein